MFNFFQVFTYSFIIFLISSSFSSQAFDINLNKDSILVDRFKEWVNNHKIQSINENHLARIFNNWVSNDQYIKEINNKNLSYTLGHNAYSGMNLDEFAEFMGFKYNEYFLNKNLRGLKSNLESNLELINPNQTILESLDWREYGMVNPIQNQESCGSCYSFSATSTLESAVGIKYGFLPKLSEQQIVSCSLKYGNLKCNGGYYNTAWEYVKDNQGLCLEKDYPYTSGKGDGGKCLKSCVPVSESKVKSYVDVEPGSDLTLIQALNVGPVSIAIEADTRAFQLYSGGIFNGYEECNKNSNKNKDSLPNIDHAVVVVGYGSQNGQDYYILRNSWGTSWGDTNGFVGSQSNAGYMLIARGPEYGPYGMCGVLYDPMYPQV